MQDGMLQIVPSKKIELFDLWFALNKKHWTLAVMTGISVGYVLRMHVYVNIRTHILLHISEKKN